MTSISGLPKTGCSPPTTAVMDDQFNLRRRHPLARHYLLVNAFQSLLARSFLKCELDVSYGDTDGQSVDIFPASESSSPVFVFIHGGYFRALDKRHYRYISQLTKRAGYTCVLVNYDLAPRVRVAEIVEQVLRSFAWVRGNINRFNGDPDDLILCGHSVGAFLVAKILEHDWPAEDGRAITRAALLSGLYDLGPMKASYLNEDLQLTDADVAALSPVKRSIRQTPELLVAVGETETAEFLRQSRSYAEKLRQDGVAHELVVLPRANHYSMSRTLATGGNVVAKWVFR